MAPTPWDPKATPYPTVRRSDFVETFKSAKNGEVEVKDPYQWLHQPDSDETKRFVQDQGTYARAYLQQYKDGDKLKEEITKNYGYARCTSRSRQRALELTRPAVQFRLLHSRETETTTSL